MGDFNTLNKNRKIQFRVDDRQYEILKRICDEKQFTMSKLVLSSLDYYIENNIKTKEK